MKFALDFSEEARRNYADIFEYIALDNPKKAIGFTDELYAKAEMLKDFPTLGGKNPKAKDKNRRILIFKNYKIYYFVNYEKHRIEVNYIRHGAMKEL